MKASRAIVEKYIGRQLYNPINLFQLLPELKSNLDKLKEWNENGSTVGRYFDD